MIFLKGLQFARLCSTYAKIYGSSEDSEEARWHAIFWFWLNKGSPWNKTRWTFLLSMKNIKKYWWIFSDYTLVENWPTPSKKLGAISAVALDVYKNVVVFHRVDRIWNGQTFNVQNVFQQRDLGPISENTIVTFDRDTGNVVGNEWGKNMFYMPHGLHIRGNYYYVTDVGRRKKIY